MRLTTLLILLSCSQALAAFFGPKPELKVCNGSTCSACNSKKVIATARSVGFKASTTPCLGGCTRGTYVTGPGISKTIVRVGEEKQTLSYLKTKVAD